MKTLCRILAILLTFVSSGCYGSMTGTVVDAETGKPIEGAVVLVEWTMEKGLPGLSHSESYKVVETISDKEGKFKLSAGLNPLSDPPDVTVYKKGYVAWNNKFIFPDYKKREDFKWQKGYMFRMEKFREEYSYDAHTSFIHTATNSSLSSKKLIEKAYRWEELKAFEERKKSWSK